MPCLNDKGVAKTYSATGGLPARARLVAWVAGDGDDVSAGDPLLELEEA